MEDNTYEETAIKINLVEDAYYDKDIIKFKDTNLPLNGKYEDEEGNTRYYKNGKKHNENGPAFITNYRYKEYCINGKRHRIDGPAIIYSDGHINWCINGHQVSNEIMKNWLMENDITLNWKTWTDSDKMLFALHWSDYSG